MKTIRSAAGCCHPAMRSMLPSPCPSCTGHVPPVIGRCFAMRHWSPHEHSPPADPRPSRATQTWSWTTRIAALRQPLTASCHVAHIPPAAKTCGAAAARIAAAPPPHRCSPDSARLRRAQRQGDCGARTLPPLAAASASGVVAAARHALRTVVLPQRLLCHHTPRHNPHVGTRLNPQRPPRRSSMQLLLASDLKLTASPAYAPP